MNVASDYRAACARWPRYAQWMSGQRVALRVTGVGWTRLCDYTEPVTGELVRRDR